MWQLAFAACSIRSPLLFRAVGLKITSVGMAATGQSVRTVLKHMEGSKLTHKNPFVALYATQGSAN